MKGRSRRGYLFGAVVLAGALFLAGGLRTTDAAQSGSLPWVLIGLGDSLTHGTMDAHNNALDTASAYLQRVRNSLAWRIPVAFNQPFLDDNGNRLQPFRVPTNLAVDGEDSFSLDGLVYYKRAGATENVVSDGYLANNTLPFAFGDLHDAVLYPINAVAGAPVSQLASAEYLLSHALPGAGLTQALVVYWVGNNDSSTAALGAGGANPTFFPLPVEQIAGELPGLSALLAIGEALGLLSFEPYTPTAIDRNLTDLGDFIAQQAGILTRLVNAAAGLDHHIFVLTLPYYSSVGYLFDSEDIEYYLQQVDPAYAVPPSFARVAPPGQPITNPLQGDRISLLTFGIMYTLLDTGAPVAFVNGVLEENGVQRDGMVLTEAEVATIMARIDGYNAALAALAGSLGPNVHLVDVGSFLNDVLTGESDLVVSGHPISRKWIRGSAFTFDGVHPGYTGQAAIADFLLPHINAALGIDAPLIPLPAVIASDPYVDNDGDGWAPGPPYANSGLGEVLFFFKDPDDANPAIRPVLPPDVWQRIAAALLKEVIGAAPALRPEAERLGLVR